MSPSEGTMSELHALASAYFKPSFSTERGRPWMQRGLDPIEQIRRSLESGLATAKRSLGLLEGASLAVLDVGCSWGPIVFGAASNPRVGTATGVDIDASAIRLGREISANNLIEPAASAKVFLKQGVVEQLPFPDHQFDLITCHTVIEHVLDVEKAIAEMYRVLRPGGILHLEAPNYIWPKEPHVNVYMPPLGPKWVLKLLMQICSDKDPTYIDHLQFVYPSLIEQIFVKNDMPYRNIYLEKLESILVHAEYTRIVSMRKAIRLLHWLHRTRMSTFVFRIMKLLSFYPSIEYRVMKPDPSLPDPLPARYSADDRG